MLTLVLQKEGAALYSIPMIGFSDPVSSWSHLLSAGAALLGGYFLFKRGKGNGYRLTALGIYTFSLVFLFSMSGVYHLLDRGGVARDVLQRLDHAGIWVLIAGTFTPIHTILFRGAWRWLVLLFIWSVAITGLVLQVIFFKDFPEELTLSLFLGLGWVGLLTVKKFHLSYSHKSIFFLVMGGVYYSIGAVLEYTRWPVLWTGYIGPHEIFHIFVIIAAYCHWRFIHYWAGYPVSDKLTFDIQVFANKYFVASSRGERLKVSSEELSDLKEKILTRVNDHYWPNEPKDVHLKYFKEEHLVGGGLGALNREKGLNV